MRVSLLVLVLVAVGCAAKQECKLETIPPSAHGGAFLWRAHKGGDVVWLYGTIHDSGLGAVPRVALNALEKSVRFVSELDPADSEERLRAFRAEMEAVQTRERSIWLERRIGWSERRQVLETPPACAR